MREVRRMLDGAKGNISFHMPGHKGRLLGTPLDNTELPQLDDLHDPSNAYAALEKGLAQDNGAARSFALVGGSTLGVQAMLLAALQPGDTVLVQRDCHHSVWSAAVLGGFSPVSIYPRMDRENGLAMLCEEDVLAAIRTHIDAKAVFLTHPDYYGRMLPLTRIAGAAHQAGMLLLVDEAHGAHLPYMPPHTVRSAGACGTDLWCQSVHKTLPALTQTAVLHLSARAANLATRVRAVLRLLETSSPSSLLALSIEDAMEYMRGDGKAALAAICVEAEHFTQRLTAEDHRYAVPKLAQEQDPLHLPIDVAGTGKTGYQVQQWLITRGIDVELADERRVLALLSPLNTKQELDALYQALIEMPSAKEPIPFAAAAEPCYGEGGITPREAFFLPSEPVALCRAAGRISAVSLGLYPPGTPLVVPGERITPAVLDALARGKALGGTWFGITKEEILCVTKR